MGAQGLLLLLLVWALLCTTCTSTTSTALLNRVSNKARSAGIKAGSTALTAGIKASQAVVKASSSTKRVSQRSWEAAKAAARAARTAGSEVYSSALSQQDLQQATQQCTALPEGTGAENGGACSGQELAAAAVAAAASGRVKTPTVPPAVPSEAPQADEAPQQPSETAAARAGRYKGGFSWWLVLSHMLAVALGWWLGSGARPQQQQQQQEAEQQAQQADTLPQRQKHEQQRPEQQQRQQQQAQEQQRQQPKGQPRNHQRPSDAESQAGAACARPEQQQQQQRRTTNAAEAAPVAPAAAAAPAGEQQHAVLETRTSRGSIGSIGSATGAGDAEQVQQDDEAPGSGGMSRTGSSEGDAAPAPADAAADEPLALVAAPDEAGDKAAEPAAGSEGTGDGTGDAGDAPLQPPLVIQAAGTDAAPNTQLVQRLLQQAQLQPVVPGQQPVLVVQQVNYNTVNVGGREVAKLLQPVIRPLGEAMDTLKHLADIGRHWMGHVSKEQAAQQLAAQQALVGRAAACGQLLTLLVMGYTALSAGRVWELHAVCRDGVQQPSWWSPTRLMPGSGSVAGGLLYLNCITQQLGLYVVGAVLLAVFVRVSMWMSGSGPGAHGRPSQMYQLDLVVIKGLLLSWLGAHTVHCLGGAWVPWLGCWLAWCACQLWLNVRHVSTLLSHVLVVLVAFGLPVVASGWAFTPQALIVQGWLLEHAPALRWLHQVAHWKLYL